jgi:transcriptional regulator with XRE-family HTH domain
MNLRRRAGERAAARLRNARRLALFLKLRRAELGMTQAAIAERAGMTETILARYERADHFPNFRTMGALAKGYDVSIERLMAFTEEPTSEGSKTT